MLLLLSMVVLLSMVLLNVFFMLHMLLLLMVLMVLLLLVVVMSMLLLLLLLLESVLVVIVVVVVARPSPLLLLLRLTRAQLFGRRVLPHLWPLALARRRHGLLYERRQVGAARCTVAGAGLVTRFGAVAADFVARLGARVAAAEGRGEVDRIGGGRWRGRRGRGNLLGPRATERLICRQYKGGAHAVRLRLRMRRV